MTAGLARFSRSATPSVFGKRTKDIRSKVSDQTKDGLERLWRSLDFSTEAEFIATLIEIRVHGVEHVESIRRERVRAVAGMGQEKGSA